MNMHTQDILMRVPPTQCTIGIELPDFPRCEREGVWTFNGYALCDECISSMASMNSDNAEAFAPAMARLHLIKTIKDDWQCAEAIGFLTDVPFDLGELARCTACKSVLCGVCGECHSFDLTHEECLHHEDHEGSLSSCQAWHQAVSALREVHAVETVSA